MSTLAEQLQPVLASLEALRSAEPLVKAAHLRMELEAIEASPEYQAAKKALAEAEAAISSMFGKSATPATPERAATSYSDYTRDVVYREGRIYGKINGQPYDTPYPLNKGKVSSTARELLAQLGGGTPSRGQVGALTQAWHHCFITTTQQQK
ncbi:MAG: hypothetical protein AB1744_10150 [Candidatus Zixiibacteriota bacterium]